MDESPTCLNLLNLFDPPQWRRPWSSLVISTTLFAQQIYICYSYIASDLFPNKGYKSIPHVDLCSLLPSSITSKPLGVWKAHLPFTQSVQKLNYAKEFSVSFKERALIASSLPANVMCQVQPSSEILANQSQARTFSL